MKPKSLSQGLSWEDSHFWLEREIRQRDRRRVGKKRGGVEGREAFDFEEGFWVEKVWVLFLVFFDDLFGVFCKVGGSIGEFSGLLTTITSIFAYKNIHPNQNQTNLAPKRLPQT